MGECEEKAVSKHLRSSLQVPTGSPVAQARKASSTGILRGICLHPFLLKGKEINMGMNFHIRIHSTHIW